MKSELLLEYQKDLVCPSCGPSPGSADHADHLTEEEKADRISAVAGLDESLGDKCYKLMERLRVICKNRKKEHIERLQCDRCVMSERPAQLESDGE